MKQGRADSDKRVSNKVEPRARVVLPGGVDALGQSFRYPENKTPLMNGVGYNAPPRDTTNRLGPGGGRTIYPSGAQGKR